MGGQRKSIVNRKQNIMTEKSINISVIRVMQMDTVCLLKCRDSQSVLKRKIVLNAFIRNIKMT